MTSIEAPILIRDGTARGGAWLMLRDLFDHPRGRLGLLIVGAVVLFAVFGSLLTPWSIQELDLEAQNANNHQPLLPFQSAAHMLGTDILARDMFSRVVAATRVSLLVAIIAQVVIVLIGVPVGAIAGWFGGRIETILMRITDVVAAFPQLVFIIMFQVAFYGTPFHRTLDGLLVVMLGIALLSWVVVARLVRAEVLSLKHRAFVEAAQALGVPGRRIIRRHLVPNMMGSVVIAISAGIPTAILIESTLSFLGLGIQPPSPSLGSLIYTGTETVARFPHLVIIPAVALLLILVGFTLLGDGLRDVLDPRLRKR